MKRSILFCFRFPPPPSAGGHRCLSKSSSHHSLLPFFSRPIPSQQTSSYPTNLVEDHLWPLLPSTATTDDTPDGFSSTQEQDDSMEGFDEIDEMRWRRKLFYKIDRDSKEYEEYSVRFHKTKSSRNKEAEKKVLPRSKPNSSSGKLESSGCLWRGRDGGRTEESLKEDAGTVGRKIEVPSFNQVTDPYHLPFCLDIHITKGSVRACVVHRVTSKVVAVAHSISKDMRFDLRSRKDVPACSAVGAALAQRAIADDIHNVVYTPRKGEKIEGKLQVVLQAIMDYGVEVKLKLKSRQRLQGVKDAAADALYTFHHLNSRIYKTSMKN